MSYYKDDSYSYNTVAKCNTWCLSVSDCNAFIFTTSYMCIRLHPGSDTTNLDSTFGTETYLAGGSPPPGPSLNTGATIPQPYILMV